MDARPGPSLKLRVLGGFELRAADGQDLTPPGKKLRALIACLALAPGTGWTRERLTALLWGDREEEQARGSLRQALVELRRIVGDTALRADRDTVALDCAAVTIDAGEFARLAKAGALAQAADLYRGDLLDGVSLPDAAFADWMLVERTRLHDLAIAVLSHRLAGQGGEVALKTAQRLLDLDPNLEGAHRALMEHYAARGDRAAALRQYQVCRENLQRDLGVKPEPETERLCREIQGASPGRPPRAPEHPAASTSGLPLPVAVEQVPPAGVGARLSRLRRWAVPVVVFVVAAVGGMAAWRFLDRDSVSSRSFPSIAILPFDNISEDAKLDYFGDGVSEDILTMLSRFPDIGVVSRDSGFAYRDKNADPRQIGRELGVDYVLRGAVQVKGGKLRITAQLIDTITNRDVWAESYGKESSDPWALHDEVTERIVASLTGPRGSIQKKEYDRTWGKETATFAEYDYYLRGHQLYFNFTKEDIGKAREIWQEGLRKFPDSSLLRVKIAWTYFNFWYEGWSETRIDDLHRSYKLVKHALADPTATPFTQWKGQWLLAYLETYFKQDPAAALAAARAAHALGPYDVTGLADLAEPLVCAAWHDPAAIGEALAWTEEALRRDPNGDMSSSAYSRQAWAYYSKGEYDKAIEQSMLVRDPGVWQFLLRALSHSAAGRPTEAKAAVTQARELLPDLSLHWYRTSNCYPNSPPIAHEVEELRKLGVPEF